MATRNLPEIAQALKVAHVLEGSVQRSANRVRVSAQLIDARNDTHVWAEKYDRDLADVFAIQSQIAEKIADQLQAKLSPKEKSARAAVRLQPDSGETHLAQAIHFYWGYLNYDRAREELAKAQHALPNNAQIFQFVGLIDRRQGRWDEAVRNSEHALDLDPRN